MKTSISLPGIHKMHIFPHLEQIKLAGQLTTELKHKPQIRTLPYQSLDIWYIYQIIFHIYQINFQVLLPALPDFFSEYCLILTEPAAQKRFCCDSRVVCPLLYCRLRDFLSTLDIIFMNKRLLTVFCLNQTWHFYYLMKDQVLR